MGRKPKIRSSFWDDGQFLLRLGKAIENDERFRVNDEKKKWAEQTQAQIVRLATRLLNAPIDDSLDS